MKYTDELICRYVKTEKQTFLSIDPNPVASNLPLNQIKCLLCSMNLIIKYILRHQC